MSRGRKVMVTDHATFCFFFNLKCIRCYLDGSGVCTIIEQIFICHCVRNEIIIIMENIQL